MTKEDKDALSATDIVSAERMVDRIIAENIGKHVSSFFSRANEPSGMRQSEQQMPSLDQEMPNGKKLRDCTKRDLLILGHAYLLAAERCETDAPQDSLTSHKPPKRQRKK